MDPSLALVIGATGGIGAALQQALETRAQYSRVIGLSRHSLPPLDLTDEASIEDAADWIASQDTPLRLVIDATGFLHDDRFQPEKSRRDLDPDHLAKAFAINAIGPGLLMKHLLGQLPRDGRSVFVTLSARVGSIGDNRLGGWHAYRASKAALNQLVRTCSVELARTHREAVLVSIHPGTVDTRLSEPFAKRGLDVRPPTEAAQDILTVIDGLTPADTGGFFDHRGDAVDF